MIVILPLMPLGVDHKLAVASMPGLKEVILPLMPLGVDHSA